MTINNKPLVALLSIVLSVSLPVPVLAHFAEVDKPPIKLRLLSPKARGRDGIGLTTRWPLILRLQVKDAVAFVESNEPPAGRREALVIKDPDGCLDMRNFPIVNPGTPYEDCTFGQDELFTEFTSEKFDSFDLEDTNTGNFLVRETLVDDAFVAGMLLNKPYLRNRNGQVRPVSRPQTGGDLMDGYGYGADDDLPGLVIMADIGGARVFTPDFDLVPGVIRNLAGFINTVSEELRDKRGNTSIVASAHVLSGLFEPIAQFDLSVDDPHVDFLRRLESGPIEGFKFSTPPANDDELLSALLTTYSPVDFKLRAVVVKGVAPAFIHDMDGNHKYTAKDLELMGHTMLSNQVRARIIQEFQLLITETPFGRTCPPRSMMFGDLDGNLEDGEIACSGSGGARRGTRIPQ